MKPGQCTVHLILYLHNVRYSMSIELPYVSNPLYLIVDEKDFTPILREVVFVPQGSKTTPVRLNITDDDESEPVEDLRVRITSLIVTELSLPIDAPAINVTIIDDDTRKSVVWVSTRCSARNYHDVLIFCGMQFLRLS